MIDLNRLTGLQRPVVLASASPRRKQLLEQLGMTFTIQPSAVQEEAVSLSLHPALYVQTLAAHKARDIAQHAGLPESVVIGADTIVVHNSRILNKPVSPEHAREMLLALSGQTHTVYTGIALVDSATKRELTDVQQTEVVFRALMDEEIDAYIATGSPLDKAGAYGIQDDFGAVFVERINGCYYNVVGLPLPLLYQRLREFSRQEHSQARI